MTWVLSEDVAAALAAGVDADAGDEETIELGWANFLTRFVACPDEVTCGSESGMVCGELV